MHFGVCEQQQAKRLGASLIRRKRADAAALPPLRFAQLKLSAMDVGGDALIFYTSAYAFIYTIVCVTIEKR